MGKTRQVARCGCLAAAQLLITMVIAPALFGQVSASLSGVVTDQSGSVISGARVTAKNLATAAVRTTSSSVTGQYRIFSLPVGNYEVRATKQGFAEQIHTGIRLEIGQDAQVHL